MESDNMSLEQLAEEIEKRIKDQDAVKVLSVQAVNFEPHPFMIGPRHVKEAADHHFGSLGREVMNKIPCSERGCTLMYDDHTYDTVCFLQLQREATKEEVQDTLASLFKELGEGFVTGFSFVETDEKFRMK